MTRRLIRTLAGTTVALLVAGVAAVPGQASAAGPLGGPVASWGGALILAEPPAELTGATIVALATGAENTLAVTDQGSIVAWAATGGVSSTFRRCSPTNTSSTSPSTPTRAASTPSRSPRTAMRMGGARTSPGTRTSPPRSPASRSPRWPPARCSAWRSPRTES